MERPNGLRLSRRAFCENVTNRNEPLNCGALARLAPAACWAAQVIFQYGQQGAAVVAVPRRAHLPLLEFRAPK